MQANPCAAGVRQIAGSYKRFHQAVLEKRLSIVKADLGSPQFSYLVDQGAWQAAERLDGKLLLVTSLQDLSAESSGGRRRIGRARHRAAPRSTWGGCQLLRIVFAERRLDQLLRGPPRKRSTSARARLAAAESRT